MHINLVQFSTLCSILFLASCFNIEKKNNNKPSFEQNQASEKYGSGDIVFDALLDRQGNMWFTTSNDGVYKYDGKSFTNFRTEDGLCGEEIWAVMEGANGHLWFASENGLCKYDGNGFSQLSIPQNHKQSDWMSRYRIDPNQVCSLLEDSKGNIWIGTVGSGVYRYDGDQFENFLNYKGRLMPDSMHNNMISSIVEDTTGRIWFSSFSHGGVSRYDGKSFIHFDTTSGLCDNMVASLYQDERGRIWASTRNGGFGYFIGDSFDCVEQNDGSCSSHMVTLLEIENGLMFAASYARGQVCIYDGVSLQTWDVDSADSLLDIKCMAKDRNGYVWFGGRYGALWCFNGKQLIDYTDLKSS